MTAFHTIIETHGQSRATTHVDGVAFRCGCCNKVKPVQTSGGTGYGWPFRPTDEAKPYCYECCSEIERRTLIERGKGTLYFVQEQGASYNKCRVTDWPGELSIPGAYSVGRHNMAGKRYDVEFILDGFYWHGVTYGDNTQICHVKRTKRRANAH